MEQPEVMPWLVRERTDREIVMSTLRFMAAALTAFLGLGVLLMHIQ